jgi:hypothetical protein
MQKTAAVIFLAFFLLGAAPSDQPDPKDTITDMLHELPRAHDDDETEDERRKRMAMYSDFQWDVSERLTCTGLWDVPDCSPKFGGTAQQLRRLLLLSGWWETRYSLRVHKGECRKGGCDGGKAVSAYQVHDQLFFPEGLWASAKFRPYDGTLAAGLALSQAWKSCNRKYGILGVLAAYGRGKCKARYPTLGGRVKWYFDLVKMP